MGRASRKPKSSGKLDGSGTGVTENNIVDGNANDLNEKNPQFVTGMMEVSINDQQGTHGGTEVEPNGYHDNLPIEIQGMTTQVITSLSDLPPHIVAEMIQQGNAHGLQAQFYQINNSDGTSTTFNASQFEVSNIAAEEIIGQELASNEELVEHKHQIHHGQSLGEPTGLTDEDRQVAATLVAIQHPQRHGGPTLGLVSSSNGQLHTIQIPSSQVSQHQQQQHHHSQIMSANHSHMSLQAGSQLINPVMVNIEIKPEKVEGDGSIEEVEDQKGLMQVQLGRDHAYGQNKETSNANLENLHNDGTHHYNADIKSSKESLPHKKRPIQRIKTPAASKKGSRSNAKLTKSDEIINSIALSQQEQEQMQHQTNNLFCNICNAHVGVSELSKFFEHLKMHFEPASATTSSNKSNNISDYQAASILVEASTPNTTQPSNRLLQQQTGTLSDLNIGDDLPASVNRVVSQTKRVYKPDINCSNLETPPSTSTGVIGSCNASSVDNSVVKVILQCQRCKRTFRREKTFQAHINTCLKEAEEEEEFNGEVAKNKKALAKHEMINVHQDVGRSQTDIVTDDSMDEEGIEMNEDDTMLDEEEIDFEIEDEEEEEVLLEGNACPGCDEVYPSRVKLEAHLKKAHPELAASVKANKKKKGVGPRKQEVLKCSECNRIFNHRNSLVYHMRSHTGERPHQCEMCGKSFFATSALKVHMRLHSGEKPYKCDHCGRHFRQWGDLKYHVISIHSDIRQYQCEFCGKDFARKYSLIVHRRIHTGERNYKCDFCDKCFRAASYLQNHRRIHTGEKPHSCIICGKPFRVRSDMKRHMSSHNRDHHNHAQSSSAPAVPVSTITTARASTSTTITQIAQQNSHLIQPGTSVVTVSNSNQLQQLAQVIRGQSIQVPATSATSIVNQHLQHVSLDDSNEPVISGDIHEGTPISITLSQDARGGDGGSINVNPQDRSLSNNGDYVDQNIEGFEKFPVILNVFTCADRESGVDKNIEWIAKNLATKPRILQRKLEYLPATPTFIIGL